MTHDVLGSKEVDRILSYLSGEMKPSLRAGFETHLESCETCVRELRELGETALEVDLAGPLYAPPARLRERVIGMARAEAPAAHIVRKDEGRWHTIADGVRIKQLYLDEALETRTFLVRMDPGALIPPHLHTGREHCFVLEGEVSDGESVLTRGDYVCSAPGVHEGVRTGAGCLLLLVASIHDYAITA